MLSLHEYGRSVFQFAPKEVEAHLTTTVLRPLGLCAESADEGKGAEGYFSILAKPPATTSIRFAGSHLCERAASACAKASSSPSQYISETMTPVGLPYCICLRPAVERFFEWPPLLSSQQQREANGPETPKEHPVVILVDTGCGEAVLRGADVFVPGIYTSTGHFAEGQPVLVGVYMERTPSPSATSSELSPFKFTFATGHAIPAEVLVRPREDIREWSVNRSSNRCLVIIGEGVAQMDRTTVFARLVRGVAVRMTWTPLMQPSLAALEAFAQLGTCHHGPSFVFLQNYSSMVPVQLLVNRLRFADHTEKPVMLLDACAAPGGKTSLLLSLMKDKDGRSVPVSHEPRFRLVCCERSFPRYRSLLTLLESHFAEADEASQTSGRFLSQALRALCTDVNKLPSALAKADPALRPVFDGILLDPSCSGLGLRPRLQPHVTSKKLIEDQADYQRVLFRSCMSYLRMGGNATAPPVIVYSTCTITLEENEGNVLRFLETYPSLRLARAQTVAEVALCAMSAAGEYMGGRRFLLEDEIMRIQSQREVQGTANSGKRELAPVLVLRFMPRWESSTRRTMDDGVGFFVAVFERVGGSSSAVQ